MALLGTTWISGSDPRSDPLGAWGRGVATILFALLTGLTEALAQTPSASECQIKAAFLFNFTQFVEWPAAAFPDPQAPLIIAVLGEDPFGPTLDGVVRGEASGRHPIKVERYQSPEEIGHCHVLFIGYRDAEQLDRAFAQLKGRSILTVGDVKGFATRGGMIRFLNVNNKIRLRVNVEAARSAGLILSSKLLRPAEIVITEKP